MSVIFSHQPNPKVTFLGAAGTVTGSMHLLQYKDFNILLDCGLERDKNTVLKDDEFPFDPEVIDAVILSHNHSDHCGKLPALARKGFRGQVYCTPASKDLLGVVLKDSVNIQEKEAKLRNKTKNRTVPSQNDTFSILDRCVPLDYGKTLEIRNGISLRFHDAGHLLGSAISEISIGKGDKVFKITYTGDLGRFGLPFHTNPSPVPAADLLICESTYGGKYHDNEEKMAAKLDIVMRDTIKRGGKILMPAFSLGRTQMLLYYLETWMLQNKIPRLPIFLDSPLAVEISRVYKRYNKHLSVNWNSESENIMILDSWEEAQTASFHPKPAIIVASGGMCEGGKILSHLKNHLDDPRTSIALVSFQAPTTLGSKLLEKKPSVYFHGKSWNKWAEIHEIKGFSGHADQNDFNKLLSPIAKTSGHVRLVHGEPESAKALASELSKLGFKDVKPVRRGESVTLT